MHRGLLMLRRRWVLLVGSLRLLHRYRGGGRGGVRGSVVMVVVVVHVGVAKGLLRALWVGSLLQVLLVRRLMVTSVVVVVVMRVVCKGWWVRATLHAVLLRWCSARVVKVLCGALVSGLGVVLLQQTTRRVQRRRRGEMWKGAAVVSRDDAVATREQHETADS
jgi:hypothetical protein